MRARGLPSGRSRPGPCRAACRIEYEAALPGRPILERSAICRFAAEGLSPNKAELIEIVTEQGPLSGASLYLLKRYYLDSPEGVAGDPGSPPALTAAEIPPKPRYLLQQLLSGLPRTAIYGLLAVAYSLVFGLTGRINLAFGEIAAIGSAATVARRLHRHCGQDRAHPWRVSRQDSSRRCSRARSTTRSAAFSSSAKSRPGATSRASSRPSGCRFS